MDPGQALPRKRFVRHCAQTRALNHWVDKGWGESTSCMHFDGMVSKACRGGGAELKHTVGWMGGKGEGGEK